VTDQQQYNKQSPCKRHGRGTEPETRDVTMEAETGVTHFKHVGSSHKPSSEGASRARKGQEMDGP
jgi:hypothetical protein